MPEFQLDGKHERAFKELDCFTQGYIEALFFTNSGDEEDELNGKGFTDLAPVTLDEIVATCKTFQEANAALLDKAYALAGYDSASAGRDLWYTSQGHGCGYWDGDLPKDIGDALSKAAGRHEFSPYIGDNGLVYLA